ncbi:MAG TPA: VanZ family protein [Blastocatellia bacterium]|nr:VanZ family protein [Blastocatellia bacterium]
MTARRSLAARLVRYWAPVLLMIGLMYWFSSDSFSGDRTQSALDSILSWLFSGLSRSTVKTANFVVRKSAHFIEYCLLTALLYRAFRQDNLPRWHWRWALYSLAIVVALAFMDEYHQSLTISREGSIYDSLLDISGGLFAVALIALFGWRRDRRDRLAPGGV